jgi:asparagine synthase (glutamine-hydrolysing)
MRRAMANILPREIQWRVGKSNLEPNFTRSLLAFERERLEQLLVKDPKAIEAYADMSVLNEAYQRGDAEAIWPAVLLALWLRRTGLTP